MANYFCNEITHGNHNNTARTAGNPSTVETDGGFQACILTLQSNRPLGIGIDSRLQF